MRILRVADVTMKECEKSKLLSLTFKEKLEITKLLDSLNVDVIEVTGIEKKSVDYLRIKSMASAVKKSTLAVPVKLSIEGVDEVWNALKEAKSPRLQVEAALSPAQMEYIHKRKPDALRDLILETIKKCLSYTEDVEFVAIDATRADQSYLYELINAVIDLGVSTVTLCDSAGTFLPTEFRDYIRTVYENVPALKNVNLGIRCADELSMADASAIAGVMEGAGEVKAAAYPLNTSSLESIAKIITNKEDLCKARTNIEVTRLRRSVNQIKWICESKKSEGSPFEDGVRDLELSDINLDANDTIDDIAVAANKLGYDLSKEDLSSVYSAFKRIALKKERVGTKELDAIIASEAMQVPPTYELDSYLTNNSNVIASTSHIKLKKDGELVESVCVGDGPIDASFLALEKITGKHYELDDFQIQSVTEGHEAMGETVVKLRAGGKIYSGRGISTDIIGSSIRAYINALNKIVYEGEQ